jgi:hypothetical protein
VGVGCPRKTGGAAKAVELRTTPSTASAKVSCSTVKTIGGAPTGCAGEKVRPTRPYAPRVAVTDGPVRVMRAWSCGGAGGYGADDGTHVEAQERVALSAPEAERRAHEGPVAGAEQPAG